MAKDNIRMAFSNLGDFYLQRGNLEEATKIFSRCREFCSIQRHSDEVTLNLFNVNSDRNEFIFHHTFISPSDIDTRNSATSDRIQIAIALSALQNRDYMTAAKHFLAIKISRSVTQTFLSTKDIAVYGTLLAIGTLSRDDLRNCSCASHSFSLFLEELPLLQDFIRDFLCSRYSNCAAILAYIRVQLNRDLIVKNNLNEIMSLVLDRIVLQYVEPFVSLDIVKMAELLKLSEDETIKRLSALIVSKKLAARIDCVSKIMYRTELNVQTKLIENLQNTVDSHIVNANRVLFRLSLLQCGFDS